MTSPSLLAFVLICLTSQQMVHSWSSIDSSGPKEILKIVARKVQDGTIRKGGQPDKFHFSHAYQQMYGMYLLPFVELKHSKHEPIKFLEIGLGCSSDNGIGHVFSGLTIWKEIFDISAAGGDQIWMGEYNEKCVERMRASSDYLNGVFTVTGDQGDRPTLKRWINQTGGQFDIIIDDGAHLNTRIYNSFDLLWPEVKPGGLYFIEDLQVTRNTPGMMMADDSNGEFIMAEVIRDWIDQLMVPLRKGKMRPYLKHRLPGGVKWIMCQMEACVLQKCEKHDVARCS